MSSEKETQVDQVDLLEPSEDLVDLLAKIERSIVSSIIKGIDILEETSQKKEQEFVFGSLFDEEEAGPSSVDFSKGENFFSAIEPEKQTKEVGVQTDQAELGASSQKFALPDYSGSIDLNKVRVQISSPINLVEIAWPELKTYASGVYLTKGFYKIEYTLNNVIPYFGLGLFDSDRTFKHLLVYHRAFEGPPAINFQSGHF